MNTLLVLLVVCYVSIALGCSGDKDCGDGECCVSYGIIGKHCRSFLQEGSLCSIRSYTSCGCAKEFECRVDYELDPVTGLFPKCWPEVGSGGGKLL